MTDLTTLLAAGDARPAAAPDSPRAALPAPERKPRSGSLCAWDGAQGAGLRALHDAAVAVVEGVQAVRAALQVVGDANAACGDALVDESQPDTACARQAVQKMQDVAKRLDVLLVGVGHTLQEGVADALAQLPLPPGDPDPAAAARAASLAVNTSYVRSFQTTLRALQFVPVPPLFFPSFPWLTLASSLAVFHQNVL